jgi:hypothetical protein
MTTTDASTAPAASGGARPTVEVEHMDVTYKVRGRDRLALRDISFRIESRSESPGRASPRWRWRSPGTCRAMAG